MTDDGNPVFWSISWISLIAHRSYLSLSTFSLTYVKLNRFSIQYTPNEELANLHIGIVLTRLTTDDNAAKARSS